MSLPEAIEASQIGSLSTVVGDEKLQPGEDQIGSLLLIFKAMKF